MEPEPGRCRRTDGKKWRCSRDVLPDQKYCERHMHRGRQCSRKHVEVTKKVAKLDSPKIVNSKKTPLSIKPPDYANKVSDSLNQLPAILQPIHPPSSNASYKVCSVATHVSTTSCNVYGGNNCNAKVKIDSFAGSTAYITTYSDSNGSFKMKRSSKNIISNSETVALGSEITPKGVLLSRVVCDASTTALTETPLMENAPKRCRRTDGRKWRCSSEVLPDQKYCILHMHRGVKKLTTASNPVTIAISPPPLAIPKNLNMGSPHGTPITSDGTNATSGSSSGATTITDDENTSDSSKYIIRARDANIQTPF